MHLFYDSTLNTWRLITEKLPDKPVDVQHIDFTHPTEGLKHVHIGGDPLAYENRLKKYNKAIAALKQNALTVGNEELIAKGIDMDLETVRNVLWHGELIHWPGAYETKEKDIFVEAGGNYIHTETTTVAILTLPEEKKNTMHNMLYSQISLLPNGRDFLHAVNDGLTKMKTLESELAAAKESIKQLIALAAKSPSIPAQEFLTIISRAKALLDKR